MAMCMCQTYHPISTCQENKATHLSVCSNHTAALVQELGHVIVSVELPQAGLEVQVAVESQGLLSAELWRELVGVRVPDHVGVLCLLCDEAVLGLDLAVVEEVGAAVGADAVSVFAERELEVGELAGGDDGQHTIWGDRKQEI